MSGLISLFIKNYIYLKEDIRNLDKFNETLKNGKIEMLENQILTDEEIKDGLVLTCQSIPASDNIIIDHDEV